MLVAPGAPSFSTHDPSPEMFLLISQWDAHNSLCAGTFLPLHTDTVTFRLVFLMDFVFLRYVSQSEDGRTGEEESQNISKVSVAQGSIAVRISICFI